MIERQEREGSTALVFLGRPRSRRIDPAADRVSIGSRIADVLLQLRKSDWRLGVDEMLGRSADGFPCFDASWAGQQLVFGILEAPTLPVALSGIDTLDDAGWRRLFRTGWIVGLRDLPPVEGERSIRTESSIGFLALWNWNDAWHLAQPSERLDYDRECDEAFEFDRRIGIDMSGRHRSAWASEWDHFSVWEAETLEAVDQAMKEHERVRDFMFTTSQHVIGRKLDLSSYWRDRANG
jgi:hypothetical protein